MESLVYSDPHYRGSWTAYTRLASWMFFLANLVYFSVKVVQCFHLTNYLKYISCTLQKVELLGSPGVWWSSFLYYITKCYENIHLRFLGWLLCWCNFYLLFRAELNPFRLASSELFCFFFFLFGYEKDNDLSHKHLFTYLKAKHREIQLIPLACLCMSLQIHLLKLCF